jgi:hypothetical protein
MTLPYRGEINIDASNERCKCHPDIRTFGRLFNWADSADCNMKTRFFHYTHIPNAYGCLFIAKKNIAALEELRWDYGDIKNCREMFSDQWTGGVAA